MSFYFKSIKPGYDAEENDDYTNNTNKLDDILRQDTSDEDSDFQDNDEAEEDGFAKVSFDSLKRAQDDYDTEERKTKKSKASSKTSNKNADVAQDIKKEMALLKQQRESSRNSKTSSENHKTYKEESFDEDSESDSDDGQGLFEEEESRFNKNDRMNSNNRNNNNGKKKKSNHAPSEQSSKKRVSLVRDVPGLEINKKYKESSIYQDIRFDKSLGKSEDFNKIRSRYKFLDEYRENEIKELEKMLKDKKFLNKMEDFEINKLHEKLTSMKSKLQTLKNKDLENDIIKNYTNDINSKTKNKFYLKESDKRKIINKYKFDHMKASQREKTMERKRKKQLGKEMRQFEFNK